MALLNPSKVFLSLFLFSFIPIFENGYVNASCKACNGCSRSCLDCPGCEEYFTITRSCALAMAIGAGVGVYFAPIILAILGFTAAGVSVGSLAALWQSTMAGVIAKGGIFSILQGIGAAGFSYSGYVIVAGAAGAAMCNFCEQLGSMTNTNMRCASQICE